MSKDNQIDVTVDIKEDPSEDTPQVTDNYGSKQGRVKWFNHTRGYGFITCVDTNDAERDYFVHHSNIFTKNSVYKTLTQGEYVQFNEKVENNKYYAYDVTGINGGILLCEVNRPKPRKQ